MLDVNSIESIRALCRNLPSGDPAAADEYRARLPAGRGLAHVSIEVHRAPGAGL